jgi:prephenate dehydrogenase
LNPIKKISIIGVGLIGGSLGLALKHAFPRLRIVGYDRTRVLEKALARGAVDEAATDVLSAVIQSDCIFFATPIAATIEILRAVGRFVPPRTIVTDTCSVKRVVLRAAKSYLPKGVVFIGGHPMAGSERSGIDAADPLLFENAYYILCPEKRHRRGRESTNALVQLIEATGGRVLYMDAGVHDRIVASVSHLPQLLAVALMNVVAGKQDPRSIRLAAGGFRSLTRVASSDFTIWKDILRMNTPEVSRSLGRLIKELREYKTALDSRRVERLATRFSTAKKSRELIPRDVKGFHHPLVDVFVSVEDKPGSLSRICAALARRRINISDLELLKVREGETGTFRMSFESVKVAREAMKILANAGYRVTAS